MNTRGVKNSQRKFFRMVSMFCNCVTNLDDYTLFVLERQVCVTCLARSQKSVNFVSLSNLNSLSETQGDDEFKNK